MNASPRPASAVEPQKYMYAIFLNQTLPTPNPIRGAPIPKPEVQVMPRVMFGLSEQQKALWALFQLRNATHCCVLLGLHRVYIGIMEKKMETAGIIGVI